MRRRAAVESRFRTSGMRYCAVPAQSATPHEGARVLMPPVSAPSSAALADPSACRACLRRWPPAALFALAGAHAVWFATLDCAAPRASRRRPLRRDRARDGGHRRLGDAAPQRPQVFREAAAPVLGDRRRLSASSACTNGRRACGRRSPDSSPCWRSRCAGYALGGVTLGAYAGARARRRRSGTSGIAQIVTLDSGLSFFLALGFSAFVIAQRAETARERAPDLDVARLRPRSPARRCRKGLIGLVLPGGALVVYTALTRDFALWRRLHLASGLVLYLALDRAVVRRRLARQRRILPVLLHPRALSSAFSPRGTSVPAPWYYFVPWFAVGMLPWLTVLALRRRGARGATARPTRSASRGSASRSSGPRSSSCSSARRDRSCRRTSCRCSRRSRSSSAGCCVRLDTRTLMRLHAAARRRGKRAGAACSSSPTTAMRPRFADERAAGRGAHRVRRLAQGRQRRRRGRRHRRARRVPARRLLAEGTLRGLRRAVVDGAGRRCSSPSPASTR